MPAFSKYVRLDSKGDLAVKNRRSNARMEAGISWKKCLEASINDIYYMCFLYMSMHIHMDMCICICICIGISML